MFDFLNRFRIPNRNVTAGLGSVPVSTGPATRNTGIAPYRMQPQGMQLGMPSRSQVAPGMQAPQGMPQQLPSFAQAQSRMQPQMQQQNQPQGGIGSYLTGAPEMKWQLPQWMQRQRPQAQQPQMQQPQTQPQPGGMQGGMQPQQQAQPQVDLSKYNPNNFGEFISGTKTSAELMPVWQQLLDARSKLPPNAQHAAYTDMLSQLANASMHRNVEAAAASRKAAGAPESSWYPENYTPQTTVQGLQGPKIG